MVRVRQQARASGVPWRLSLFVSIFSNSWPGKHHRELRPMGSLQVVVRQSALFVLFGTVYVRALHGVDDAARAGPAGQQIKHGMGGMMHARNAIPDRPPCLMLIDGFAGSAWCASTPWRACLSVSLRACWPGRRTRYPWSRSCLTQPAYGNY